MKRTFISIFICWPLLVQAQDTINPYNIGQPMTIILQNTNAYYRPMKPPDPAHDTREGLSNQGFRLRDSNGVGNWGVYLPQKYDSSSGHLVHLKDWAPYGTDSLGLTGYWQRLFTAHDKPGGEHSDIIAGDSVTDSIAHGPVIIDSLEDVDFRASGEIRLESGFRALPGSFFHGYIEPTWGKTVLSDEFDSSAIDRNQWLVSDSASASDYGVGPNCAYDSNITLISDADAHDGKALDIALIQRNDTCNCFEVSAPFDSCAEIATIPHKTHSYTFSTGLIRTCPFPYQYRSNPVGPVIYAHAPYGKYEVRKKVPHIPHHMNDWGWAESLELDNESDNQNINSGWYHAELYRNVLYGPFKGTFKKGIDTEFISHGPDWWQGANNPEIIVIDGFPYRVKLKGAIDTVVADGEMLHKLWPASVVNRTDFVTFYYARQDWKIADSLLWTATPDVFGQWRIINMPYHINRSGDTLRFSKSFQPMLISIDTDGFGGRKTFDCRWDSSLNSPVNKGLLYLDGNWLRSSDNHAKAEAAPFFIEEGKNYHYSLPPVQFTNPQDSASYFDPSSYQYHTFTIELLPNEAEFLLDGNVVRRYPDRLIPPTDKHANWISTLPRFTPNFHIGQMTLDGVDASQMDILMRHIIDCPGCSDVTGNHAAHTRIDYVKIFDVPDDVRVSGFPQ
jgi:hypothetical protein